MSRVISYRQALNEAMAEEMRRDPNVFVYGIGVNDFPRIFGSTAGLLEEFGPDRCIDTPVAEDTMTGFGLGAAINGKRPIHVHIRVDFLLLAVNQIVNMLSAHCYGSNGTMPVPMVIRAVIGRGWGQSWQHSKSLQSWFAHIPGLEVVMPATPRDAKGMLIAAIRNLNPVIFLEHRWLYDIEDEVPDDCTSIPLQGCQVLRTGAHVTIVATSWMVVEAMQAAKFLGERGVGAEVIDCRSITDFNISRIFESVACTKNCIIADNDWMWCGFGSEIAAQLMEAGVICELTRINFGKSPCPCARPLENAFYPNARDIVAAAANMLGLVHINLDDVKTSSYENRFRGPF